MSQTKGIRIEKNITLHTWRYLQVELIFQMEIWSCGAPPPTQEGPPVPSLEEDKPTSGKGWLGKSSGLWI